MKFFKFFKYQWLIDKIVKAENLEQNLSAMFGSEVKRDWVGRYWTVINPYVQDMKDNIGGPSQTLTYDETGRLSNTMAVEKWVMDKLNISSTMMFQTGLFELLSYEIKPLDEDQNYLIIFKNIFWDEFVKTIKGLGILTIIAIIAIILWLISW